MAGSIRLPRGSQTEWGRIRVRKIRCAACPVVRATHTSGWLTARSFRTSKSRRNSRVRFRRLLAAQLTPFRGRRFWFWLDEQRVHPIPRRVQVLAHALDPALWHRIGRRDRIRLIDQALERANAGALQRSPVTLPQFLGHDLPDLPNTDWWSWVCLSCCRF